MKKIVYSGIRLQDDGNYVFDYTYNLPEDIIDIVPPQLYKSEHGNHVYWFGYQFKPDVTSKERTNFINYIKGLSDAKIPDRELRRLIELPLDELDQKINLYDIDCFIYPLSGRSKLVSKMVQIINDWTDHDMYRLSFELVKSAPTDIEFDWKSFKADIGDDEYRYSQMSEYVKEKLIPSIRELDYFSLAHDVKPKYRKYIKNYLSFNEEDLEEFAGLQGKNILIVDDINTSGSTLKEIFRVIGKVNNNCNIYVYTLIGK